MEPIRITDKLTLRQEALRMAVGFISATKTGAGWMDIVGSFESYLLGNADLPEYEDTHKDFKEMLAKMQDSFKPNPWISVDDEQKPAKGVQVLCALHYAVNNIVYEVMYYNPDEKVWYGGADEDNTNHVVAWTFISPYVESLRPSIM